ncbi:MAG: N-acetylneuraminate synthase family protein [Anaerolineaceae bacterium]|nr:N-acetylneuraminate synthase family protein [Anaerolineaceae bacterium]
MKTYQRFEIDGKPIGKDAPCWVVGEVSQTHDGSLGNAHCFIDMVADAGADAIKFQTHIAHAESSAEEPFRVKFSQQDDTRYDYWKRMEFKKAEWAGLYQHAKDRGLVFLSSPFSEESVDLLSEIGMPAWKIASGEVTNPILMRKMMDTKLPILLSSGMSSVEELDAVIAGICAEEIPMLLFQCTSKYPVQPQDVGLNMLDVFRQRYHLPVGLSDHSGTIFPGLAAAALGVDMIEVHVTLSDNIFGPDVPVSLTPPNLKALVDGVRFIEAAQASPVNKDLMADELSRMRKIFGRSLTLTRDLPAGHVLEWDDLSSKKPGYYILVQDVQSVLGKTLKNSKQSGEFLKEEDLA